MPLTYDPRYHGTKASDPIEDVQAAREYLQRSRWFDRAKMTEAWPMATEDVVRLMHDGAEYDIDADGLLDLLERRIAPKPSLDDDGDALEWDAHDVVLLVQLLEGRRQWRYPSAHDSKRSHEDIILQQARAKGDLAELVNAPAPYHRQDVAGLLALLEMLDSRIARDKVSNLLKAVLEIEHDIFVR